MSKNGPILLIDDDEDDFFMFNKVIKTLGIPNELKWFENAIKAFEYLLTSAGNPFLIFCDINMPMQNGLEFKSRIDNDPALREKSIPFIFYSTSADDQAVHIAYTEMMVQGFFKKGTSYAEVLADVKIIIDYWKKCRHPNDGH